MASSKVVTTNPDLPRQSSVTKNMNITVDEVWKDIVAGTETESQQITLDDFLNRGDSVGEDTTITLPPQNQNQNQNVANGIEATKVPAGGRGKRRAVEEPLLDKATLQKQRRMIKNRESAARSRERKQAYTVELESLVMHLEEENARLLREEADKEKQRFNQLMQCVIPVVEKRKPRRMLRRVNSVQW